MYDKIMERFIKILPPIKFETMQRGLKVLNDLNIVRFEEDVEEVYQYFQPHEVDLQEVYLLFDTHIRELVNSIGLSFIDDTPLKHIVDRLTFLFNLRNDVNDKDYDSDEEWLADILATEFMNTEFFELEYLEDCMVFREHVDSLAIRTTNDEIERQAGFISKITILRSIIGEYEIPDRFKGLDTHEGKSIYHTIMELGGTDETNESMAVSILIASIMDRDYRDATEAERLDLITLAVNIPLGRTYHVRDIYTSLVKKYHMFLGAHNEEG